MTPEALHALLTRELRLLPEPVASGVSRTYFLGTIDWHPQRHTRVLRVLFGADGEVLRIQLCARSDNNNTELLAPPFTASQLTDIAQREIDLARERLQRRANAEPPPGP